MVNQKEEHEDIEEVDVEELKRLIGILRQCSRESLDEKNPDSAAVDVINTEEKTEDKNTT